MYRQLNGLPIRLGLTIAAATCLSLLGVVAFGALTGHPRLGETAHAGFRSVQVFTAIGAVVGTAIGLAARGGSAPDARTGPANRRID
jgi:hypothetical protein